MSNAIANIYATDDKPEAELSVMGEAVKSEKVSNLQSAMMLAKSFPRDERKSFEKLMLSCQRHTLADRAMYQYSRGGTDISGPSIRLAVAVAVAWGNIRYGFQELERANGQSTVETFAIDLESNVMSQRTFQVKHVRETKQGHKPLVDGRDIYELIANQAARRMRACILEIIPCDVVDAAVQQCEETLKAKVAITPELIKRMLESFQPFGVTKEHIEKRIQRKIDAITPTNVLSLKKILNSLNDGMSKPEEWFEIGEPKQNKKAEPIAAPQV